MRPCQKTCIRLLGPDDVRPYRDLMLHAYEANPDSFTSSRQERERLPIDWWARRLSDAPQTNEKVFGAIRNEALIGVCGLSRQTGDKTQHKVKILGMFVLESARSSGLGAQLLRAALNDARQTKGITLAQLSVSRGNDAALRLYENLGFTIFGIEPMAVAGADGYIDKLHMWLSFSLPSRHEGSEKTAVD